MHPVHTERTRLLVQLERMLEKPMIILSLAWVILIVMELMSGLTPLAEAITTAIWVTFIVDFAVKLVLAPKKGLFLRRNWIGALSLLLPAFRLLRLARIARAARLARLTRGIRLAKFLGSMNRGSCHQTR